MSHRLSLRRDALQHLLRTVITLGTAAILAVLATPASTHAQCSSTGAGTIVKNSSIGQTVNFSFCRQLQPNAGCPGNRIEFEVTLSFSSTNAGSAFLRDI